MAAQLLEANLQSAGIRSIVTSRAKNPLRLESKVRQRAVDKNYSNVNDIYEDIVDLAGVRVALYFPAEREEVGRIIQSLLVLTEPPKIFPGKATPNYSKRFSGYWATHYRIRLTDSNLNETQKRYSEANIEIQVASVLMHAWSEVEHDLVYKPLQGKLSEDEYAILDELNGMVLAGEIALERLQRAAEARVSVHGRKFTSHYDVASYLLEISREKFGVNIVKESAIGRVDQLYSLLTSLDLAKPESLAQYIDALHSDLDKRPLAEQVIDQILAEDPDRYIRYELIKANDSPQASSPNHQGDTSYNALTDFIMLWVQYEKLINNWISKQSPSSTTTNARRFEENLPPQVRNRAYQLRRVRNHLVHGLENPSAQEIVSYTNELRKLITYFERKIQKDQQ